MARSTCVKCDGNTFEGVVNRHIRGLDFAMVMIQCTSCGGVVGVTEYYSVGHIQQRQNEALKSIARAVNAHVDL
jgi:hypothetical protein